MSRPISVKKRFLIASTILAFGTTAGLFAYQNRFGFGAAETTTPHRGTIVEAVYGLGTIVSHKVFDLKLGITSTIRTLHVKEGDFVAINASLIEFSEGNTVKAPFAGTVTQLPFQTGENVFPQTTILQLIDLKDRYVLVSLEQQGAMRVKPGQKAALSFESLRNQTYGGTVRTVYPNAGEFLVAIDSPQLPDDILPDMTADVAIEIARKDDALLVPVQAVSSGRISVFKDGKAVKRKVTLGLVDGPWAEIVSGDLNVNDQIIVEGP